MRPLTIAAIAFAVLPAVLNAQTFRAVNYLDVVPLKGGAFEVIETRAAGPRAIWCAAADYAERRLGGKGRVYLYKGHGPSQTVGGRKSVAFTTDANNLSQGPSQSYSLSISQIGVGLPIAHAIQFCGDVDYDLSDIIFRRN
jgi:hypothetical protein